MAAPRPLFVNHASRLGGAEMVLLDVAAAFDGAGAFLFEDGPLRPALAARGVTPFLSGRASGFASIKRDRSLLRAVPHLAGLARTGLALRRRARDFGVVYANSQKAFVLAAPAAAAAGRRLVWHLHDILAPGHFAAAQIRLAVALANRFASRVIVPSQAAASAFVAAGGRSSGVRVVPNGVDDPAPPPADRGAFGLAQPRVFGVFSRLAPWKGQEVALRALAALPGDGPDGWGCIVAGDALFGEAAYSSGLPRLAAALGVADRVRFLGQRDDVPALMRAVDAAVHPSTAPEPFGRTLVEAMLAGTPVIASAAGAVPEILDGGAAGVLVAPGDHAALAAALRGLPAGGAADLVARARARALACYTVAQMRDGVRGVLDEVAGDRAP